MKVKLSDICLITSSKRIFEREYVKTGVPFIRGQEVSDGSIEDSNSTFECYISKERYNELKEKYIIPKKNDILITAVGTIGNLYYVDNDFEFYFKDGNLILFTNFSEMVYPKYLYYFMKSPYFKKQIEYSMIGAVQKALTMVMLSKIEIDLPSYNEQVKIANIFSKLDNKIKNNKNINSELESMAKTIYDYWFLQYEFPNEEGKPYKSSGGKMVFNEELKKEIPEGWKVEKLEDMLEILKDGTHNPPKRIEHGIPLLTGTMFGKNFLDYKEATYISKDDYEKIHATYAPKENDLIITKIGTLGNVNYLTKEDIPLAIHCNSALLRFKKQYKNVFPFLLLKSDEFQLRMKALRGKSIQEFISLNKLGSIVCLIPDTHKIERFENYLNGIFEKMKAIRKEDEELTKLRDELLPLLMNGQVSFKN